MNCRYAVWILWFFVMSLTGCATIDRNKAIDSNAADKSAIHRILLVPPKDPTGFNFPSGMQSLNMFADMGARERIRKDFEAIYEPYRADLPAVLADSVANTLRTQGYVVEIGQTTQAPDAVLELYHFGVGYTVAFDSEVLVPQIIVVLSLKRANDQATLFQRQYVSGGGMWGPFVNRIPHDPQFEFRTAEQIRSQPKLVSEKMVAAVRLFGTRLTSGLSK